MTTLKETAIAYSGKKELYNLDKIPVDIEFKTAEFTSKDGKQVPFNFIEIDGYKYTIKANMLEQIKNVLTYNTSAKFIKFQRAPNGDINCIPLLS